MLRVLVASLVASFALAQDPADEQYAFVAGLAERGQHQQVIAEAERFLARFPRHAKADLARYRLACARFELDQPKEARAEFARLAERRGFEFEGEVAFRLGQCELDLGDCAAATRSLERAVGVGRDYLAAPARFLLGEARFACGDFAGAAADYRAVLAAAPQGEYADDALAGVAWCAYREQRFDEVEAGARRYGESFPRGERSGEMRYLLGEALLELARPREALECFAAVREGELADGALRGAGFAQSALGDHARAAQCFERVLEGFPGSRYAAECALHAGIEWLAADRPAEARRALSSPAAGESLEVLEWRGRAEARGGDHAAAAQTLERALGLARDDAARARLAGARADELAALGRADEALAEYQRAGDDYALAAAAVAHLDARRWSDAAATARRLLERFPRSEHAASAQQVLGEAELGAQRFAEAERAFAAAEQATADPARRLRARSRRAWCRYLGGDARAAAPLFAALAAEPGESAEIDEAAFMAPRALEEAGDAPGAREGYERYLAARPRGAKRDEAALRAALLDEGDSSRARLERLVREGRDAEVVARARFELAERLSRAGRHEEAAGHYRALLDGSKNASLAPAARYGLAWCLQARGDVVGASELLAPLCAAPELEPGLRTSAAELAVWCEAKRERCDELLGAWKVFAAACGDDARRAAVARTALDALRRAKRTRDAEALLAELEPRVRDGEARAALAVERVYVQLDAGDLERAERSLADAAARASEHPGVAEAAFFVGEARWAAGAPEKALAHYDRAARNAANPALDRALYKAGFARLSAGDLAGAERDLARLVAERPQSPLAGESWFLLGEARFRARRFAEAIEALETLARVAPKHEVLPKALFRLGLARAETGDWQGAADALADLAQRAPEFEHAAEAELARGKALARVGRARDARAALERTLALDQGLFSARAHLELGRLAAASGDQEAALSEFLKVAVLYDAPAENAEALLGAGRALEAQGDARRATERYRELVERFPASGSAGEARERLRALGSDEGRGV